MLKKLKPCNYTSKAKQVIINNAITQKEELDGADSQESEYRYSLFSINERSNFCFSSFTGSPIHLLALGLVSNII